MAVSGAEGDLQPITGEGSPVLLPGTFRSKEARGRGGVR